MESPTAADYFGSMVESYDSLIRRAVPRYEEMTERLLAYMPDVEGRHARSEQRACHPRILELGCGTGNLTLRLLARYPDAEVTAVDAAAAMTEVTAARAKAAGAPGRLKTVTGRFEDVEFGAGSFDLIASCMSLHHVRGKGEFYRRMAAWLSPGGALRFGDQFMGATAELHRVNWEMWLAFCRLPGNCSAEEVRSLVEHAAAHDHYTPVEEHFRLMREAGFVGVDCVWRNGMYGVVTGERAQG